jgi:hypothetical protein
MLRKSQRQHHEQRHRILLHDAFVDAAPAGYDKRSPDPKLPRFSPGALALYAWLCGHATDALDRLTARLPTRFRHAHPRTLRRFLFAQPGELYLLGPDRLLVVLHATRLRPLWQALLTRLNRDPVRIPWLLNRKLLLNLAPKAPALFSTPQRSLETGGGRLVLGYPHGRPRSCALGPGADRAGLPGRAT